MPGYFPWGTLSDTGNSDLFIEVPRSGIIKSTITIKNNAGGSGTIIYITEYYSNLLGKWLWTSYEFTLGPYETRTMVNSQDVRSDETLGRCGVAVQLDYKEGKYSIGRWEWKSIKVV